MPPGAERVRTAGPPASPFAARPTRGRVAVAALALALTATATQAAQAPRLRVGAAVEDITPVPGFPTGGHSRNGAVAHAYWGRLTATALYFETDAGDGLALVSCDLFAVTAGIHAMVVERLEATSADPALRLRPERLVIAATHTHHGPGNFLSAAIYNGQASARSGYSPALREFLVSRIATAVRRAATDARADLESRIDIATHLVGSHLFMNRSPRTFMRDAASAEILASLGTGISAETDDCARARRAGEPRSDWRLYGCPRLRAVDRNVTALRVWRAGRLHAAAVFLNAHPTVTRPGTPIMSADVFGVARARLAGVVPVVAFFNGAEGDVVTRRRARHARDLADLGRALADELTVVLQKTGAALDGTDGLAGRLHFAAPGDVEQDGAGTWRLAREAVAGVATLGGAEGDRTILWRLGLVRPDVRRRPRGEQGVKVPALGGLRRIIARPGDFPQALPIGVIRIGALRLATVPTEVSTATGWQIRRAVGAPEHGRFEIVALANDYASYTATRDEYDAQDYMGASTLWGPEEAGFLAAAVARLGGEPPGISGTPGPDAPGRWREFGPRAVGRRSRQVSDRFRHFLDGGLVSRRRLPAFEWCERPPTTIGAGARTITVVDVDGGGTPDADVLVVLHGRPGTTRARWAAIWLTPLWAPAAGRYRFRVVTDGTTLESDQFTVGHSPPDACERAARAAR